MREHIELRILRSLASKEQLTLPGDVSLTPQFMTASEKVMWSHTDAKLFARYYLLTSLLKKWKGFKIESADSLESKSMAVWRASEQKCFETNYRFNSMDSPMTDSPVDRLIRATRKYVIKLIGMNPPSDWKTLADWPTGATYDTKRSIPVHERTLNKVSGRESAVKHLYGLYEFAPCIVKCNRLEFVPKTFKVHRPIACEPTANAFLQKGVGRALRRALLERVGFDLRNQAEINRANAFLCQSCELATLDLEAASDTLSYSIVKLLLPEPWFDLLNELRSPFTSYKGQRILLEKFSSMGNGYTFELETVIFRAIGLAVYELNGIDASNLCNFGDDIVCDRSVATSYILALQFFGFTLNKEKSFVNGKFFESCGRHYYDEREVTPVYLKDVCKKLPDFVILYNKLFRWAQRTADWSFVNESLRIVYKEIERLLRGKPMPIQPSFLDGDMGILSDNESHYVTDPHGDIIMRSAVVKLPITCSLLEQPFYYQNWLRCGNSFYANHHGRLEWGFGERFTLMSNYKRWRSSAL